MDGAAPTPMTLRWEGILGRYDNGEGIGVLAEAQHGTDERTKERPRPTAQGRYPFQIQILLLNLHVKASAVFKRLQIPSSPHR